MKKIVTLALSATIFLNLFSQKKPERAPLNPEYVNYMNNKQDGAERKSTGDYKTGYVPSPMYLHFNPEQTVAESKKSISALPTYYNLRDFGWVTPVRDQGAVGACWSFSTMGAIESRWLKLGFGDQTLNLSEQNMATCHGFQAGINDGGSDFIAAAYLSRLSGPVTEASDPYFPSLTATCKTGGLIIPAFSPQTIWLPKDVNIVKKALMDYGALTASVHMGNYSDYFSIINNTFYYDGTAPVDHGVLVVGWDDNLTVTGKTVKPKNKGAWIVKNSWGTSFGDDGYYYVSYEDSKFLSSCSYYPERIGLNEIDTMIMYDWLGSTSSFGFREDSASAVARFEASEQIFINKIGTFVNASGSFIDIEIYSGFENDSILTGLIASSQYNFCQYPGYYTFDIPALLQGTYYVKVKYFTPGYNYPIPVETMIEYQGEPYALPALEPSGRFWITSDEQEWLPLGNDIPDYEADLSIRVYAERDPGINAFFTSSRNTACINGSITFTEESIGTINNYSWNFGAGANPATASTQGPHTVQYTTGGLKNITLAISGPAGNDTLVKNSYVEVVSELEIFLPYSEVLLVKGKSIPLIAYGADTYTWSPSTGLNATAGSLVIASPLTSTEYTVTGNLGACTGQQSVKINVVEGPSNDDVCNAIELRQGTRTYKNIYATVEDGEPAPPEGDCNTPLEWCVEGGLQNSVWFWFTAPAGGKVTFTTEGMDTQIALYRAEHCDSILLGNYEMIAANDDYFGEDKFYAAALELISVIPGEKYFIQIDGSAGGEEGNFNMIYWEAPISVQSDLQHGDLAIYPNPNQGVFKLAIKDNYAGEFTIRVYNTSGQSVYSNRYHKNAGIFEQIINPGVVQPGVYILEVITSRKVERINYMIE